jgi:hypothetical protein
MRTLRVLFVGLCLVALSGCWYHRPFLVHRPFLAHRYGWCPPPPCCAPVPHCACYLGAPIPTGTEPPIFVAPQPGR